MKNIGYENILKSHTRKRQDIFKNQLFKDKNRGQPNELSECALRRVNDGSKCGRQRQTAVRQADSGTKTENRQKIGFVEVNKTITKSIF